MVNPYGNPLVQNIGKFSRLCMGSRNPSVKYRVGNKKVIYIPKLQMELSPNFIGNSITKKHIFGGILAGIHPSHDIGPDFIRTLVKLNHVAGTFMHRLTILRYQSSKAQNGFKRNRVFQKGAHCQKRVKPVFKLSRKTFRNKVSREPFFPIFPVRKIKRFGF